MTIVDDYQGMYYGFDKTLFENNCSVVETAPASFILCGTVNVTKCKEFCPIWPVYKYVCSEL